ncbi:MAG: PhzF family phenazine biosynthesis protein, partial [Flammeovirgaceae bacterium]
MKIKLYQIDAFANRVFTGNPAAVCILDEWLDDAMMQNIAAENNLAETAFAVKKGTQYELRWFTPTVEVDLCGHATLATAFVLFTYYQHPANRITFHSPRSGKLTVDKSATDLILDFPTDELHQIEAPKILLEAFDCPPQVVLKGKTDFLLIFQNQQEIERLNPDLQKLVKAGDRGVIVSAQGDEVDFVS